jgi:hypothetical protein
MNPSQLLDGSISAVLTQNINNQLPVSESFTLQLQHVSESKHLSKYSLEY